MRYQIPVKSCLTNSLLLSDVERPRVNAIAQIDLDGKAKCERIVGASMRARWSNSFASVYAIFPSLAMRLWPQSTNARNDKSRTSRAVSGLPRARPTSSSRP